ncbi:hypothetical protein GCM10010912_65110 [Paenibacillus albidus]|uniref:Uncharacterized protein n=1 Tax=Paenibacillus albidus TaxID=2041023 RepID=A0A917FV71_9BACL|nr:hypothetical protein [Paenibacillus albidus]GGG11645.1 hypothetical protein GCM10010912_65110 [Paenibacillus albidus]
MRIEVDEDSNEYRTLQDQYDVQNIWWEKPGHLYPFLIKVDKVPAGFAVIAEVNDEAHCKE